MRDGRRILAHLTTRREAMAADLVALAGIESPSTAPETQAAVQRWIGERLEALGFDVRILPGQATGGALYARPRRREPGGALQLLLGHGDTVWPLGTLVRMPAAYDGTVVRGPGVFDAKGGLVQMLHALAALADLSLAPEVAPLVLVTSDEEIGSHESSRPIRRLAGVAERVLVLEPALGPDGRIKTTRKGLARFEVRVGGRSAHGGLAPETGASAIRELSRVVDRLYALEDHDRGLTVNVGRIEGGTRTNVVAAEARADVEIRFRTTEDGRRIERAVLGLEPTPPGTTLAVTGGVRRPPLVMTARNRALWEAARRAVRAIGVELVAGEAGGASDGSFTTAFAATLDGLGAVGDGAHASHEHVVVDRMVERAAVLAILLLLPALAPSARAPGDAVGAGAG